MLNSKMTAESRSSEGRSVNDRASDIEGRFGEIFGGCPRVFQAPGRVNLIGEHTDYSDGFVMPAAIGFHTEVAAASRSDRKLVIHSENYSERAEFDLDRLPAAGVGYWTDYVVGVAKMLDGSGSKLQGANLLIRGNVPEGAGLSSSASIEVAAGYALLDISGELAPGKFDLAKLALLCQKAENEFVGARCGIMDQFIACHGRRDHALMLDCRSLEYRLAALPSGVSLVISNTMVKHSLATGEYNQRRAECEEGVLFLAQRLPGVRALRDVTLSDLEAYGADLPDAVRRRCRHVISENARVQDAALALESGRLGDFGSLMGQSD